MWIISVYFRFSFIQFLHQPVKSYISQITSYNSVWQISLSGLKKCNVIETLVISWSFWGVCTCLTCDLGLIYFPRKFSGQMRRNSTQLFSARTGQTRRASVNTECLGQMAFKPPANLLLHWTTRFHRLIKLPHNDVGSWPAPTNLPPPCTAAFSRLHLLILCPRNYLPFWVVFSLSQNICQFSQLPSIGYLVV
jgi:hypothetical protein